MDGSDHGEPLTCPSCGAPRLGHAWDCAECGVVFDDDPSPAGGAIARPTGTGVGPASSPPIRATSARRPGSASRAAVPVRWSGGGSRGSGLTAFRRWVGHNKPVAVIISFIFYVAVVWLFGAVIIGGTDSPGAVKNAYRDVTGRRLPGGFGPAFAAHFIGRRLVVLDRPDQILLVLYRDEDMADEGELQAFAQQVLDVLEVPWETVTTRNAAVAGRTVEVQVLRLIGEGGPHLYLVPTVAADGGWALEAVVGAPGEVLDVVEEMVRER